MSTEPGGYYGATNEDATTGRTNASGPRGIVRVGSGRGDEDALQRLIRHTGCTITEIRHSVPGGKVAVFLFSGNDDSAECVRLLTGRGYNVHAIQRK